MTNPQKSTTHPGRPATKFTPTNIQKIKDAVAQGLSREKIAQLLDVPLGSLQVTCSRLGIDLRQETTASKEWPRQTSTASGALTRLISWMFTHMQNRGSKISVHLVRCRGRRPDDIPIAPHSVRRLALKAWAQNLSMIELMGRASRDKAIKFDMIQEILREKY